MAVRLALHGLEWLAVAAATLMGLAAFAEPSALLLAACFAASIGAALARAVALRAAAGAQVDRMLALLRDVAGEHREGTA